VSRSALSRPVASPDAAVRALDLATLRGSYEAGIDPGDVIRDVYRRIAEAGERPVWITLVPEARALAALEAAQARRAAGAELPLFGMPFAVKDNIDVAGLPTTAGCPDFAYTPDRSATVVERLEAAGAILIGKTNLDQFAAGLNGTRSPYGIPACVFDGRYISGGSSSGSAVAVAAGLVSFALGTDTAGSGRVPASFNNIVGLKPTKGLISTHGVVPACRSQDVVSVFAGTVGDALAVAHAAAGFDAADTFSRHAAPSALDGAEWPLSFRFGVPTAEGLDFFGDKGGAGLFHESVARLERLGGRKVEFDYTPFRDAARLLYDGPWVAERLAAIKSFATEAPDSIHPAVREIVLGAAPLTAVDAFEGQYRLAEFLRAAESVWAEIDVMLLPTAPTIYPIDAMLGDPIRLNSHLGLYTNFVNLMDLAAIAVPAGFRDTGLPFGVTLIGQAFRDGAIATLADRLHRALDQATLANTGEPLPEASRVVPSTGPADAIKVAVVGAHLAGQPLNWQLTERGATLLATALTAPGYSLYALAGTVPPKPGLIFDGQGAGGIEVEIWSVPSAAFGSFVAGIPAPLGIGTIRLEDGSSVQGFLCEAHAIAGAQDITARGGWRAFVGGKS
jgi:allophanate hydrolase